MSEPRPPGRPRSEASRRAILTAALDVLTETGYAGLTIEGIAARAGVGKQTIYRWWASKVDVLLEAAASDADLDVPVDDHGSYAADLRAFLTASYSIGEQRPYADVLRAVAAEAQIDPAFAERARRDFVERRRTALAVITDRARDRGDLPGVASAATVADIVFGTIWYRVLATRAPLDGQLAEELVALLTR